MAIERKEVRSGQAYAPASLAIHHARYLMAKSLVEGKKVLDIACGEGLGSSQIARYWGASEVTGVDNSQEAINAAKENFSDIENLTFIHQDAFEFLAKTKNKYDVIISIETVEHVDDPVAFLTALNKLRAKDGVVLLTCPNDPFYYGPGTSLNEHHQSVFDFASFKKMSEEILGEAQWLTGTKLAGFASVPMQHNNKRAVYTQTIANQEDAGVMAPLVPVGAPDLRLLEPDAGVYFAGIFGVSEEKVVPTVGLLCASSAYIQNVPGQFQPIVGREDDAPMSVCFVCDDLFTAQITKESLETTKSQRFNFRVIAFGAQQYDETVDNVHAMNHENFHLAGSTNKPEDAAKSLPSLAATKDKTKFLQLHFCGVAAFRKFLQFFDGDETNRKTATGILSIANRKAGQVWSLGLDYPAYPELTTLELALLDIILVKQNNGSDIKPAGKIIETSAELYMPHLMPEPLENEREFLRVLLAAQTRGSGQFHALRMATLKNRKEQLSAVDEETKADESEQTGQVDSAVSGENTSAAENSQS